jgi:hypothetical protein
MRMLKALFIGWLFDLGYVAGATGYVIYKSKG